MSRKSRWHGDPRAIEKVLTMAANNERAPIALARVALAAYFRGIEMLDGTPSAKQLRTLDAFMTVWDRGLPLPTNRDIGIAQGDHGEDLYPLKMLEKLGCLKRARGTHRNWRPTKHGRKICERYRADKAKRKEKELERPDQDPTI